MTSKAIATKPPTMSNTTKIAKKKEVKKSQELTPAHTNTKTPLTTKYKSALNTTKPAFKPTGAADGSCATGADLPGNAKLEMIEAFNNAGGDS